MPEIPVLVECYEGGTSQERPRRITIDGVVYAVRRILEQSVREDRDTREHSYHFKVKIEDGRVLSLVRDANGNWRLQPLNS